MVLKQKELMKLLEIIDNYISKELLDVIYKINKYQSQYNNLNIYTTYNFHDRFIIIDDSVLYYFRASFKYLSKKYFAINRINSTNILKE